MDLLITEFHHEILRTACRIARHGSADSSPQAGFNFLCGRESLHIRARHTAKEFETVEHQLTSTTLGLGRSSEADKIPRIIYSQVMESQELFPVRRVQLLSFLSDQSVEKSLADCSAQLVGEAYRAIPANISQLVAWPGGLDWQYMYPLCLQYNDLLHILYDGALKNAIKQRPEWQNVEPHLKAFAAVFGNRAMRSKVLHTFKNQASKQELATMRSFTNRILDWEWGQLETTLEQMLCQSRLAICKKYWNFAAVKRSGATNESESKAFENLDKCMHAEDLEIDSIVVHNCCKAVGVQARWLGGCKCHDHILMASSNPEARKAGMIAAGCKSGTCIWQGRRAVDLCLGGVQTLVASLRSFQTALLKTALAKLPADVAASKLAFAQQAQSEIAEVVEFKFNPMFCELPGSIVGLYGEARGYSKATVLSHARTLLAQHASREDQNRVHRVEKYYLHKDSPLCSMLENVVSAEGSIIAVPVLAVEYEERALALLLGSSTEGLHRSIRANMLRSINGLPGLASARNRSPELEMLCNNLQFLAFGNKRWNRRGLDSSLNKFLSPFLPR